MGNCVVTNNKKNNKIYHKSTTGLAKVATVIQGFKVSQSDLIKNKRNDINEDYTFLETLGKGASGEVKRAINKYTGLVRAVKIINKNKQEVEHYHRMLNEIEILKNLDHPHIIKTVEFYQDEAKLYIVSDFYDGGELITKIINCTVFHEAHAARIMQQIFSAINYCHQHGIVHRDLKPENIVYESKKSEATLKVIDFGVSQQFGPGELLHKPLGTCYYVAPEVLKESYTEKCDLWSCGVILYFILCGHPPFDGSTQQKVLKAVVKGHYEFKEREWKNISPEAQDLIKKLLEYSPEKRLSAEEALEHPWFLKALREQESQDREIAITNLENLKGFRTERKLQEAIWIFLVTHLSTREETAHLLETFEMLDTDKNGVLSKQEIERGYKKIMGKAQNDDEIMELITKVDNNFSGAVNYSEFVSATINRNTLLCKQRLESAFKVFDKDGNGFLSVSELKDFLNPEQLKYKKYTNSKGETVQYNEDKIWEALMKEIDTNKDGKVSLEEFKNMMVKMLR